MPTSAIEATTRPLQVRPEPDAAELPRRILDRLDVLSAKVERLERVAQQIPGVVAVATDSFDDAYARAQRAGIDLDQRARALLGLVEKLSMPQAVDALSALLDRTDQLRAFVDMLDSAPGAIAMLVDVADETVKRAGDDGLDLDLAVRRGVGAALRFGAMMGPEQVESLRALLESGVLDPPAVRVIGTLGRALATDAREGPGEVGLLALLRAAREPEVRRALAFLVDTARSFGRELPRHTTALPPA